MKDYLNSQQLKRVGNQLGSNPGGIYEDEDRQRYYIKTLESPTLAINEWLAAGLYRLAGAPTLEYFQTEDPCQVATRWIQLDKRHIQHFSSEEKQQAQKWFGVHCWTANWDAAGFEGDNQGVSGKQVLTLDVGGALNFRAMGDPKGNAFGNEVKELNRLRTDPENPHAKILFGSMNKEQLIEAVEKVITLSDSEIAKTISEGSYHKPSEKLSLGPKATEKLITKMLARKAYMQCWLENNRYR